MTALAWTILAATAVVAVVDWVTVARHWQPIEYVAKPLTMLGLVGLALAIDPVHANMRTAFVVALVLSLAGDVFLMLPADRFVAGLAAFLGAHVAYTIGFVIGPGTGWELLVGAVIAAAVAVPVGVRLVRAVRTSSPQVVAPVVAYIAVISLMVAAATGLGNAWAIVGAWLFFASDALIGETRFVRPIAGAPVAIMVTYHVGQAALVLSLIH